MVDDWLSRMDRPRAWGVALILAMIVCFVLLVIVAVTP